MEVLLESEEQMARSKSKDKDKGKRQRPDGPRVPLPAAVAEQTGRLLTSASRNGWNAWSMIQRALLSLNEKFTTKHGDKLICTLPGSWPRPASVRKWLPTSRPCWARPMYPSVRLKKKTPLDGPPFGGHGDHGDDAVRRSSGTQRQGARPRG